MGDNGREAWFPFLDEAVVQLLQSLSILEVGPSHCHTALHTTVLLLTRQSELNSLPMG